MTIALITIILTSPLILALYNWLFSAFEKIFKYSNWVAIFLTNNQVYFGRIKTLSRFDIGLEDIFYLNSDDYDQKTGLPKPNVHLIKLGSEIHGPKDFMLITRHHVLFLENLSKDGQVVRAIKEYQLNNHPKS